MKRIYFIIMLSIGISCLANAQQLDVTLRVTDGQNRPLQEVVMEVEGNQAYYVTDADGIIRFSAEKGVKATLAKDFMFSRQITIDKPNMAVRLDAHHQVFDLGFNESVTKELSASAINGVTAGEIEASGQSQILGALYGLIPGLTVSQPGGTSPWPSWSVPGVNVRGRGSFSGNNVIVLVDGIQRDASTIHVDEVKSVSVLKDAAALALYGVRGADGVICISTKRGGEHKFRMNGGYSMGLQTPFRIPEMADPVAYAGALNEALANDGLSPYYSQRDILSLADGTNTVIPTVDWQKELLRNIAFNHDVNLSFDGSSRNMRYYVYTNYTSNRGFFDNTKLNDDYSTQLEYYALKLRTNLEADLTPKTKLMLNLMGRIQQLQQPGGGIDLTDMYTTPTVGIPVRAEDGKWVRTKVFNNPLANKMATGSNVLFSRLLSGDLTLRQDLSMWLDGLKAEVRVAYDNHAEINDVKSKTYSYYEVYPQYDAAKNITGYSRTAYGTDSPLKFNNGTLNWQYMQMALWAKLDYARRIGKHAFSVAGIFNRNYLSYTGANQTFVHHDYILNATYNYADRYLLNGVLSCSASSKLPSGNKFRLYPALSAAWIMSNEAFMKNFKNLDFLKLRASYGIVGMDANLAYDMDKQFNGSTSSWFVYTGINAAQGMGEGRLPSVHIQPEKEYKANVGIELGLLKGLTFEWDVFYNKRTNIRTNGSGTISSVVGIGVPDVFTGEVKNYGTEFSLGWNQRIGNFGYYVRGNFSYAKNEITNMEEAYQPYAYMYQTGNAIGRYYGLVAEGFYQQSDFKTDGTLSDGLPVNSFIKNPQPGDVKYKDLNKDGKIDNYDYTYQLGSELPEINYGFQIGADYRNLGFNAYFQGVANKTVATALSSVYVPLAGGNKNISKHYLENYWSAERPSGKYPRLTTLDNANNYLNSQIWTEKGDFLKLRELEVYYRMRDLNFGKMKLSECKFFLRGTNLFSIDNIKIFDPEYISMGYPSARTYEIGMNVFF